MINKFKALDNIGLISYLTKLVLAIRQFFATKTEMDVVATALTDLDRRITTESDNLVNYATKTYVQDYVGNGRLILKNGNNIISNDFTANKGNDTTIDLNSTFTNKSDFNLLGDKVDKINTSIAELNAKTQVIISSDDSSAGEDEEIVEAIDNPFSKQMGTITLRFWNIERYENLPVYDVWVNYVTDVVGPFGYVNYCYEIFLVIDIYDYLNSIVSSVGFTSGIYKPFFIRGANSNNHICGFDIRGNGNINTAIATVIGRYMHLKCHLQLHGGDSGTGNDIMQKAANEQFNAYLCLRQTP